MLSEKQDIYVSVYIHTQREKHLEVNVVVNSGFL